MISASLVDVKLWWLVSLLESPSKTVHLVDYDRCINLEAVHRPAWQDSNTETDQVSDSMSLG